MTRIFFVITILCGALYKTNAQSVQFTPDEFLQTIRMHHPVVKQTNLLIVSADAALQSARGAFDPYIESAAMQKEYADKLYYRQWNTNLYIPVWGGIDMYLGHMQNSGDFLNPSENIPDEGLLKAGVKMDVIQSFWNNRRQIDIAQAKLLQSANSNEQLLQLNNLFYEAMTDYIKWAQQYAIMNMQQDFIEAARIRYESTRQLHLQGDIAAIDTLEAFMQLQDRTTAFNEAFIQYVYAINKVNSYLWSPETAPLRLREDQVPVPLDSIALFIPEPALPDWMNHPEVMSYNFMLQSLSLERKMQQQYLLPKLSVHYNILQPPSVSIFNTLDPSNYQFGLQFNYPLFLRQERAALEINKVKMWDTDFQRQITVNELSLKSVVLDSETEILRQQQELYRALYNNAEVLLQAEEAKLLMGESSLFLVNNRELYLLNSGNKQITAEAKYLQTITRQLYVYGDLFNRLVGNN